MTEAHRPLVAGIDVGGSKCLALAVDGRGEVVAERRVPTPAGATALLDTLAGLVGELGPVERVGVGAPGLVTLDGTLRAAPNLPGIVELPLRAELEARLGRPVTVDNDATCATYAEWRQGAGAGAEHLVLLTLGTGIGAGLVLGGRLQRGAHGFAGEPGHMIVEPGGRPCGCGQRGCWERYASGSGLALLAQEAAASGKLGAVLAQVDGDVDAIRGELVHAAAQAGDPEALAVMDQLAWWLALGLVNLANVVDPDVFVLGGGVAQTLDVVLGPTETHAANLLYAADHRPRPRLVPAALGERAGAIGAALLARDDAAVAG